MSFSSPYSIKIDPDTATAGQDDWRSALERLERTANPSRNMLKRLEKSLAMARPQDMMDSPEILERLAKVTKLERRVKEWIVLLAMEAFSSHGADEHWGQTMRAIVSGETGRGMLARRDDRFVAIYAGMVESMAERCQDDAVKEAERILPLVREAKDLVRAALQTHATKRDVARMLANKKSEDLGDELVRRFGRFGRFVRAIGTLMTSSGASRTLNAAVLAGFLTGLAPAKASAGYNQVPTQTVSREAPQRTSDAKTTPTAKPAPAGKGTQGGNSKASAAPVKVGPNGVTLNGDNGNTKVEAQVGSGLSVPTKSEDARKQASAKAPNSLAPAASVKITNGNIQANVELMSRLRLQGADAETLWGVSAALAYMDSMQETGIAVKAAYDNKDGFKDLAARLGITVGEKWQFFFTAGMKQRFVNEVSRLVTIGDPHLKTRIRNFLASAEYVYKNSSDPTELVQDLFVIATYGVQPQKNLGKIGMFQRVNSEEIVEWSVFARYRRQDRFQVEFGTRLQINSWLSTELRGGASLTIIQAGVVKKMEKLFSPTVGNSWKIRLDKNVGLVIEADGEKGRGSVSTGIEVSHGGARASIGVDFQAQKWEKPAIIPFVRAKIPFGGTIDDQLAGLYGQDYKPGYLESEETPDTYGTAIKPNRLNFADLLRFPTPYFADNLFIDPKRSYEEQEVAELRVRLKGVFDDIERNPDGTLRSGTIELGQALKSIELVSGMAEYFEVQGTKLRIFFRSNRGDKNGVPLPPNTYRLGILEADGQYSAASLLVTFGSSKFEFTPEKLNDIPPEQFSLLQSFVTSTGGITTINELKAAVDVAQAFPEISSIGFSEANTSGAKLSVAAKNAAGGTAHVAIVRGKLTDAQIKAITLDAIKAGTVGEYKPLALDKDGKATLDVTSDTDGADITVVTFVESANKRVAKEAKGATVTLPSLAGFASVPVFTPAPNTLGGSVSATVTKTDATVYVAYFDTPLSNLSEVAKVRDATGAVAATNFRTTNKTGSGTLAFTKTGKVYGYAVTVNENGISKTVTALGEYTVTAPTEAPKLSSISCDADAETCSVQTDMAGTKVKIAVTGTNVTFEGVADKDGKFSIDYASKLAPGSYTFDFTLTHPASDTITSTVQKSVIISPNPAPTLVGELAISEVGTSSYTIAGEASEGGDAYVLSILKSDPTITTVNSARAIAEGKKTTLTKDGTKWKFSTLVDGRTADTNYVNFVVFVDTKGKPSAAPYSKEAKTNALPAVNQPPTHSLSVVSKTHNSVNLGLSASDDSGTPPTVYYVALPIGTTKPTEAQIKAGQDASGTPVSLHGTLSGATPTVSGFSPSTGYKIVSVSWDGEKFGAIDEDEFTTNAPPVTNQAPVLDSLVASGVTATAASLTCNGSDAESDATTCYAVVVASGSPQPTAAQIKAGQDASGSTAVKSGSAASGAIPVSGLAEGTLFTAYSVMQENSGEQKFSAVKSTAFATLPTLATSVPSKTHDSATLGVVVTAGSTVYYTVVALGAATPTAAQIKAGQDASGTPVSLHGTLSGATPTVSGFSASTGYKIATVAEKNGVFSAVDADEFTTDAPPNGAPTHSATVWGITATGATISFSNSDPNGDTVGSYWVVLPSSATAPSAAQVLAGQDSTGTAATFKGNTTSASANVTGLSPHTPYTKYSIGNDGSLSSAVDSDVFTTLFAAVTDAPTSMDLAGSSTLLINSTTPTITGTAPANANTVQARIETAGGTLVSDWSTGGVDVSGGSISFTPTSALAESAGVANNKYVFKFRGIDGNGTPGPVSTLSGVDIRTTGAGDMNNWGDNIAPRYQGVESQKSFLPANGFGWSVSNLACTSVPAAADTSELSCAYNSSTGAIDVTFKTKLQASYRLTITGKDAYGVTFTKTQIVSNLTVPTPTLAPANAKLTTATDANADGKISDTTPDLSADLPSGATHLEYRVDGGSWVVVADNTTTFTTAALAVGDHTVEIAGANSYGRGPASSVTLSLRTSGPGTLTSWGGTAPTKQATQYPAVKFIAPNGFGGAVSELSCTAPSGGTVDSCAFGQDFDNDGNLVAEYLLVTYTTAAQAGFRLLLTGKDAYGVSFSKNQIVSNLTP